MLKGGSPSLTVTKVETINRRQIVFVSWFTDAGELKMHHFELEALKLVSNANI